MCSRPERRAAGGPLGRNPDSHPAAPRSPPTSGSSGDLYFSLGSRATLQSRSGWYFRALLSRGSGEFVFAGRRAGPESPTPPHGPRQACVGLFLAAGPLSRVTETTTPARCFLLPGNPRPAGAGSPQTRGKAVRNTHTRIRFCLLCPPASRSLPRRTVRRGPESHAALAALQTRRAAGVPAGPAGAAPNTPHALCLPPEDPRGCRACCARFQALSNVNGVAAAIGGVAAGILA